MERFFIIVLFTILFFQSCISLLVDAFNGEKRTYAFGFMDRTGKFVIPQEFEGADRFSQGLAPVKKNDLWGYINTKGEVIIPFQFKSAKPFSDDPMLAAVEITDPEIYEKGWGFIDIKGNFVIPPNFYNATSFKEGVTEVATAKFKFKNTSKRYDKYFLTKSGKYIYHNGLYSYYAGPGRFSEGLMPSCKDGKWGFKDIEDRWVIEPKYTIVGNFKEGLAHVQITTPNPYTDCEMISEKEPYGLWGYIDKTGKEVIPLNFRMASSFSKDGLALVDETFQAKETIPSKMFTRYFINHEGKMAIDLKFQKAESFSDSGFALVGPDEKNTLSIKSYTTTFIDTKGKKKDFKLENNEQIFSVREGTKEIFRVTLQIKPDPDKYEHKYISRYYYTKDLTQFIEKDFPPCFGWFIDPPNCMTGDFYGDLAWIAKQVIPE